MNIIMYAEPDLDGQTYSEWAKSLGWMISVFPITVIPFWFLLKYCHDGGWKVNQSGEMIKKLPIDQNMFFHIIHNH